MRALPSFGAQKRYRSFAALPNDTHLAKAVAWWICCAGVSTFLLFAYPLPAREKSVLLTNWARRQGRQLAVSTPLHPAGGGEATVGGEEISLRNWRPSGLQLGNFGFLAVLANGKSVEKGEENSQLADRTNREAAHPSQRLSMPLQDECPPDHNWGKRKPINS